MKIRLDELLVEKKLASSLLEARALIGAGKVYIDDICSDKAGNLYSTDSKPRIKQSCPFVSRGGFKLEKALLHFHLDITNFTCVDIGASSGGFTDCLLQHGAARVYAVDVAYGQFSWKLRQDSRVVVMERFNARKLTKAEIPDPIDLAVLDASFISLNKLLPPLLPLFKAEIRIVALIKPQFELPKDKIEKGGVVRDQASHQQAIEAVIENARHLKLKNEGIVQSPILGPKGNKEFLVYFSG